MKWPWFLIGLALVACEPQVSVLMTPSPSQVGQPPDLIYVRDPNGPRLIEMDWSGLVHGSVSAQGFGGPSPDGSRFIRSIDHVTVEEWTGRSLGRLDLDPEISGLATWADDGRHVCSIIFPPGSGPDTGTGSLWIGAPGEVGRTVGPVGKSGSDPGIAACSVKNNRAVVAGGLSPHWPPGATRYLITAEVQVVNLSTGAIEYKRQYPLGNLGGQLESGTRGDWVLVAASRGGQYLAESGVFNGSTTIRQVPTGNEVGHLSGTVLGFSWDGSSVVTSVNTGGSREVQFIKWADQHVIWHRPGVAQSMLPRPSSDDVLIGITNPAGDTDETVVVTGAGTASILARNASVSWPCPCPAGI